MTMSEFDLADVDFDAAFAITDDEEEIPGDVVAVQTQMEVHNDGTVTIAFINVPILDVDDLFATMGTAEARTDLMLALARILAKGIEERMGELGIALPEGFPFAPEGIDLGL